MNPSALFIRRPILAFVLNALIVIAGLAGLLAADVRELPDVDRPVVTVSTAYPGAAPETIDRELTAVIGHWERVGDWSQQWLNLRYVARLLERVGDREDALVLHRALHAAGREAIGVEHRFDGDLGLTPDRADALKCARSALDRISRV